ncbi:MULTISPECIES: hypothetical protein [Actinopolyspora]|uniref:Small secreted hydrophilic protein n=1 Tax=Actinopolyspora saharensis TaxID=995062 RepID=A0A1H1FRR5_9ACTN|nr:MULTISPECIES: hypothetical protein [Actinopolyspora]NHD19457.1 hypothetical protein [Actinopolyspora sp. BKK2]NHE77397.1 hypothetical protein [Actinopolyspora sp. BKK1]SDR03458.1 hypothetical protein SAMN04489718_3188 [Actinopolyspora saharensis]
MRSTSRTALLVAALVLPAAAVLGVYALSSSPRQPEVPERVRVVHTSTEAPSSPPNSSKSPSTRPTSGPASRPPPPPEDDERGDEDELGPPVPDDDRDDDEE